MTDKHDPLRIVEGTIKPFSGLKASAALIAVCAAIGMLLWTSSKQRRAVRSALARLKGDAQRSSNRLKDIIALAEGQQLVAARSHFVKLEIINPIFASEPAEAGSFSERVQQRLLELVDLVRNTNVDVRELTRCAEREPLSRLIEHARYTQDRLDFIIWFVDRIFAVGEMPRWGQETVRPILAYKREGDADIPPM